MPRLPARTIGAVVRSATVISLRRLLRRAPLFAGWTFREELIIGLIRERFARQESIEKSRAKLDKLGNQVQGLADWEAVEVDGISAVWARPRGGTTRSGAVVLYLHGGAYGVGSDRSHRAMVERMVAASGADILVINYRLAPEHPCPAAIEDVVIAWRWMLAQGIDPARSVFLGDSAGGGLVLTGLMALRDAGAVLPAQGICLSPWTDLTLSGASHTDNAPYDYLGPADISGFARRYAGTLPLDDPRVSPAFGELSGLPPLLIHAGGAEVLLDDARMIAERGAEAGVSVELDIWPGQVHVWHGFARVLPQGQAAIDKVGAVVRGVGEGHRS